MKNLIIQEIIPIEHFWNAIKIYYDFPNSINKQILLSHHICAAEIKGIFNEQEINTLYNTLRTFLTDSIDINKCQNLPSSIQLINLDPNNIFTHFTHGFYLLLRQLIPKKNNIDCNYYEFIFLDKKNSKVFIYTKCKANVNCSVKKDPLNILKYDCLEIEHSEDSIKILYDDDLGEKGINWLNAIFVVKLKNIMFNVGHKNSNVNPNKLLFTSKIDIISYYKLYEEMKLKYAKYLIENWTENTDPKKFVFEDIGIATYLMLLWKGNDDSEDEIKKQKFIDLGCGNGLLVHILNSEGHLGVGLDLRKRKIWESYPSTTILKEQIINPATDFYPEIDWLIGNHSDELTTWIPILARRSNDHCQYFVLPCCPYQLNGQKFQRKNSSLSSYHDFINHVKEISEMCHFQTFVDKLRIPSTKRICLIGYRDSCTKEEENNLINEKILNYVNDCCRSNQDTHKNLEDKKFLSYTGIEVKIRDSREKVRNCTKLPNNLIDSILKNIMETLIEEKCDITVNKNGVLSMWNRGRKLSIKELAETINKELLIQLKQECKGLQTILKNHHYIFDVSQGYVQFRNPEGLLQISNKFKMKRDATNWKKRSCWFFKNHPDRCPLPDELCSYSHK